MVDFSAIKQLVASTLVLFKDLDISEPTGWENNGMTMLIFARLGSMLTRFGMIMHGCDKPLTSRVL